LRIPGAYARCFCGSSGFLGVVFGHENHKQKSDYKESQSHLAKVEC